MIRYFIQFFGQKSYPFYAGSTSRMIRESDSGIFFKNSFRLSEISLRMPEDLTPSRSNLMNSVIINKFLILETGGFSGPRTLLIPILDLRMEAK